MPGPGRAQLAPSKSYDQRGSTAWPGAGKGKTLAMDSGTLHSLPEASSPLLATLTSSPAAVPSQSLPVHRFAYCSLNFHRARLLRTFTPAVPSAWMPFPHISRLCSGCPSPTRHTSSGLHSDVVISAKPSLTLFSTYFDYDSNSPYSSLPLPCFTLFSLALLTISYAMCATCLPDEMATLGQRFVSIMNLRTWNSAWHMEGPASISKEQLQRHLGNQPGDRASPGHGGKGSGTLVPG
nr:uncharacterized protein LOC105723501 [Aotus nancymaae]